MNFKKLAPLAIVVSLALPLVAMAQFTSHDNVDKAVWPPVGSVHELNTQDGKFIILGKDGAKMPVCNSTGHPIQTKDLKTTSSKTGKSTVFILGYHANVIQVAGAKDEAIGLYSCKTTKVKGTTTFKPLSAFLLFPENAEKTSHTGQPTLYVHGGSGEIIKSAAATQGSKSNTGAEKNICHTPPCINTSVKQ